MRALKSGIIVVVLACGSGAPRAGAASESFQPAEALIQRFCMDCHSGPDGEAGVDLEGMAAADSLASDYRVWGKVLEMLRAGKMPPEDADQLSPAQREQLISVIGAELRSVIEAHAGEPGPVVMRRLTSAEYDYTIRDLTGLDLGLAEDFVSDAVGGEGFTNAGVAQFVQDAALERYLEAARTVADHAVIGAGPLRFYEDPGETGFELSAITRIQAIYRAHGFRRASGEGGEAYGLDRYPRAFYAAWRFRHREELGLGDVTLANLAAAEGLDTRFVRYISSVLNSDVQSFPTSEIIAHWQALPGPESAGDDQPQIQAACRDLFQELHDWQIRFGINADAKEEAPVLAADRFDVSRVQPFEMNINWPEGTAEAHIQVSVDSSNSDGRPDAVVVWRNPRILFRNPDKRERDPGPLREVLSDEDVNQLGFGMHPRGGRIAPEDFVTIGTDPVGFTVPIPEGVRSARLFVEAELDVDRGDDCIVRCTIAQQEETDQGKSVSALLANPESPTFDDWKAGVLEFARLLPQVSHREPAPSDRDPIPPPFSAEYNNPERNFFHTRIKYHRDDRFLVENILDDATRRELDRAWWDLLGSFEYHDTWLRFVAGKFDLDLGDRYIADLDADWIAALPPEPRGYVQRLSSEYRTIQRAFAAAEPGHVEDVLEFAARAWRRPLSDAEQDRLRSFDDELRTEAELDHRAAIRALIARVLVAPDFLYRVERPNESDEDVPLSDWELASRLSYFLWSSLPDAELRRAAAAGELSDPAALAAHARRMLQDEKARRFAAEFFGQWFGFYRFDRYGGIDSGRFPEFTQSLKAAMYEEAVLFFDHIVRDNRPAREILFADYTFVNRRLAEHYGIEADGLSALSSERINGVHDDGRGGLLGLGAVLTVTSAPLRTSPVRRGDWVLRRVLGTPVPKPPADAGSISPDDQPGDGLSMRQRLEAHRREASCVNCHSRIDPLGFALENYDAIGRWRNEYRDGTAVENSGILRDGAEIEGPDGLRRYLAAQEPLFDRNLCTKLVGYALGRGVLVGDTILIDKMTADLEQGGGVSELVEKIVTSRQFRYHGAAADRSRQAGSLRLRTSE